MEALQDPTRRDEVLAEEEQERKRLPNAIRDALDEEDELDEWHIRSQRSEGQCVINRASVGIGGGETVRGGGPFPLRALLLRWETATPPPTGPRSC